MKLRQLNNNKNNKNPNKRPQWVSSFNPARKMKTREKKYKNKNKLYTLFWDSLRKGEENMIVIERLPPMNFRT